MLADLLLGLPYQASITVGQFGRGYRQWAEALFAQDSWRATRKLTLNLGVRYEYSAPWTEVNHKLSNFVPGRGLLVEGQPGWDGLYAPDRNNFGPRAGFAYDVNGSGTTIVRGGFAMLYETLLQANSVQLIENNPPFSAAAFTRSPTPFSQTTAPSTTLLDLRALAQPSNSLGAIGSFRNPYTMQFAFSVQHLFGQHWLGEVAYVATRGVKLPMYRNINQVPIEQSVNAPRPYPCLRHHHPKRQHRIIHLSQRPVETAAPVQFRSESDLVVHLLQIHRRCERLRLLGSFRNGPRLVRPFAPAWTFELRHYTPLHRVVRLPSAGYSRLDGERHRHAAVGTAVHALSQHLRPVSKRKLQPSECDRRSERNVPAGYAFNPSAFQAPAAGTFGNAGRNIVRGGGFQSFDLSVFKTFTIAERFRLQLRAESVNALNRVNYQGPVTNLGSTPGVFVASAPPRIVQLGAKFSF